MAHRHAVLVGAARLWCRHADAIRALSYDPAHAGAAIIVLRTLVESWITCQYILADRTDGRAREYLLQGSRDERTFYERLLSIMRRSPAHRARVLKIVGVPSVDGLRRRHRKLDEQTRSMEGRHGIGKQKTLEQRAAAVSADAQLIYAQIYGFLFSEQVHMGAREVVLPLTQPARTSIRTEKVLVTAESLTADIVRIVAEELKTPFR